MPAREEIERLQKALDLLALNSRVMSNRIKTVFDPEGHVVAVILLDGTGSDDPVNLPRERGDVDA